MTILATILFIRDQFALKARGLRAMGRVGVANGKNPIREGLFAERIDGGLIGFKCKSCNHLLLPLTIVSILGPGEELEKLGKGGCASRRSRIQSGRVPDEDQKSILDLLHIKL